MEKRGLALLACLLFGGCGNSVEDVDSATSKTVPVKVAAPERAAQSAVVESVHDAERANSRVDASVLLASTLENAKACDKRVLVHLGAPWCGWCHKLEEFLDTNAALFSDDYLVLKIDVEEMEHGDEIAKQLRGDRTGGIPWMTILSADGMELVSSDGPAGNIGCPVSEDECAYFVSMIEKTIQHAPEGRVAEIEEALEVFAESRR